MKFSFYTFSLLLIIVVNVNSEDDSWLGQASTVLKRVYKGFMKTFEIEETETSLYSIGQSILGNHKTYRSQNISNVRASKLSSKYHQNRVSLGKIRRHRNKVERQFVAGLALGSAVLPAIAAGAAATAVINSNQAGLAEPLTEFVAVTQYNILNPLFTALGIPYKNLYAKKTVDSCYGIACNVTNEECLNGACGCFGGASCSGNINTPVCDPSSKACGVLCTFTANDADSGTETLLSTLYSTPAECAYAVWTQYPSAVAATFGVIGGSGSGQCYAEFGTKTAMASSVYTFCYLPGHP